MKTATVAAACLLSASALGQQVWLNYDPSGGDLPDTQCWTLNSSGASAPTVSGGVLNLGPSSGSAYLYYTREAALDFDRGAVLEADVFIVDSGFNGNPCGSGPRAGAYLSMFDASGRLMYLGMFNTGVYITANPAVSAGSASVAMQGVWRHIRVEADAATFRVLIDGSTALTAPSAGPRFGTTREAGFGDESVCMPGHSRYGHIRVLAVEDCRVDFNRDGFVDFFDYDDFVRCFEGGGCPCDQTADFNGDDFPDFFDYDDFVAAFEAGC